MSLRFGTDGIRGEAGTVITPEAVRALGRAGAEILGADGLAVGRDTRESGPELAAALHAGVASAGGSSVDLGVSPTPTVARWCADELVAGAVISASHNPWSDNGVKLFAPGGLKLDDHVQGRIQVRFDELLASAPAFRNGVGAGGGRDQAREAIERHVEAVIESISGRDLAGLHIVVDGSNGAASDVAPVTLERLGARVDAINVSPDGRNINRDCGSTHPVPLRSAVVEAGADMGVAFDGDADRVVATDAGGEVLDGDHVIAICAIDRHRRGALPGPAVVVTVMSNLGFRRSMASHGIAVIDTAVGDRHVLEALDQRGLTLGGEQSGHVIFRDLATTGDGLLTAVQLADVAIRADRPLAELARQSMTRMPQVLRSLRLTSVGDELAESVEPIVAAAEARIGSRGRVLVRPSGTEPVIRVMVEADDEELAAAETDRLVAELVALDL